MQVVRPSSSYAKTYETTKIAPFYNAMKPASRFFCSSAERMGFGGGLYASTCAGKVPVVPFELVGSVGSVSAWELDLSFGFALAFDADFCFGFNLGSGCTSGTGFCGSVSGSVSVSLYGSLSGSLSEKFISEDSSSVSSWSGSCSFSGKLMRAHRGTVSSPLLSSSSPLSSRGLLLASTNSSSEVVDPESIAYLEARQQCSEWPAREIPFPSVSGWVVRVMMIPGSMAASWYLCCFAVLCCMRTATSLYYDDLRGLPYRVGWTDRGITINSSPQVLYKQRIIIHGYQKHIAVTHIH